jgi:hypothetical protein
MSDVRNELQALDREIEQAVTTTRRRNAASVVLCLVSVGLIGNWLYHAHTRFAAVDPEFAADYAQAQLTEYMPQAGTDLEASLKTYAPHLVDDLGERLRGVPDRFADELEGRMKAELDAAAPRIEDELYMSLHAALEQDQVKPKGKDDVERFKSLLDALADTYRDESIKVTDQLRAEYAKNGSDVLAYVKVLAENKNLDRRQQLHRDMLQSFLVMAKQTASASAAQ